MRFLLATSGFALLALVALARLFILARWRAGWAMYLGNVVWETFPKKVGIRRFPLEAMAVVLGLILLGMGSLSWGGVALAGAAMLGLEIANRRWERRLLDGDIPSDLILTVEAPFTERLPHYRLGVLWVGRPFEIELIVSNPSLGPTATAVKTRLEVPASWLQGDSAEKTVEPLSSGGIGRANR